MKLSELKQGMVCELRDGDILTIINDNRFMYDGSTSAKSYTHHYEDGLKHRFYRDNDIMKVSYGDKVVWERKESTYWEPKEGEKYYVIGSFGDVIYSEYDSDADESAFKTQLVFKTREEAEKALLKQQAKIRVIKEIARLNEGWKPNWNENDEKHHIGFTHGLGELISIVSVNYKELDNNLYLKSEKLAYKLIETHEKDLKLMLEVE